ncbi:MAG: hypothetical protein WDO24_25040 [Pseudomonadota bacterium]
MIDAFSNNYRCSLVEEGCFDRSQASHAINLCDMHAKYADVVKLDETLAYLATLPDNLYPNLPTGQPGTTQPRRRPVARAPLRLCLPSPRRGEGITVGVKQ